MQYTNTQQQMPLHSTEQQHSNIHPAAIPNRLAANGNIANHQNASNMSSQNSGKVKQALNLSQFSNYNSKTHSQVTSLNNASSQNNVGTQAQKTSNSVSRSAQRTFDNRNASTDVQLRENSKLTGYDFTNNHQNNNGNVIIGNNNFFNKGTLLGQQQEGSFYQQQRLRGQESNERFDTQHINLSSPSTGSPIKAVHHQLPNNSNAVAVEKSQRQLDWPQSQNPQSSHNQHHINHQNQQQQHQHQQQKYGDYMKNSSSLRSNNDNRSRGQLYSPKQSQFDQSQQADLNAARQAPDTIRSGSRQRAAKVPRMESIGFQGSQTSLKKGNNYGHPRHDQYANTEMNFDHLNNSHTSHHHPPQHSTNPTSIERYAHFQASQLPPMQDKNSAAIGVGSQIIGSRTVGQQSQHNRQQHQLQTGSPLEHQHSSFSTLNANAGNIHNQNAAHSTFKAPSLSLSMSPDNNSRLIQSGTVNMNPQQSAQYHQQQTHGQPQSYQQSTNVTNHSGQQFNSNGFRDNKNSTVLLPQQQLSMVAGNQNVSSSSFSPAKRQQYNNQTIAERLAQLKLMNSAPPLKVDHRNSGHRQQNGYYEPTIHDAAQQQQNTRSQRMVKSSQESADQLDTQDKTTIMEQTSNLRLTGNPEEPHAQPNTLSQAPYGKQVAVFLESNITTSVPAQNQNNQPTQMQNKNNATGSGGGSAMPMSSVYQKFNGKQAIENKQTQKTDLRNAFPAQSATTGYQYTVNQHMVENTNFAGKSFYKDKQPMALQTAKTEDLQHLGQSAKIISLSSPTASSPRKQNNLSTRLQGGQQNGASPVPRSKRMRDEFIEASKFKPLPNIMTTGAGQGSMMTQGQQHQQSIMIMANATKGGTQTLQQQPIGLQIPPTKRQRLSLSQSRESVSEESKKGSGVNQASDNIDQDWWSQKSANSKGQNSLISDDDSDEQVKPPAPGALSKQIIDNFNSSVLVADQTPTDPIVYSLKKVENFIENNPLNQVFIKREKARLPYSVFKPHSQESYFLKSIFHGRPPTAFFPYPSYCHLERTADRVRKYDRDEIEYLFMSFKISDSTHIYNAVVNTCKNAGFTMVEGNNDYFNVQWTGYITSNDIKGLNKYQKTNHFPGSSQLGRKDLLWRNMNRLRMKHPEDFLIAPISYLLSEDYELFQSERERDPTALWILKPVAASCGRGIKIIQSHSKINKREGMLACKYISNPHLINGLKYDLRIYVLVTSFNPLKVYMYSDGLVRFATEKYNNDPNKLTQKFIHLTNFSVNKKNTKFVKNQDNTKRKGLGAAGQDSGADDDDDGANSSKWDFRMLKKAFEKQGNNYQVMMALTKDIIIKTLISVEPHIVGNLQRNPTNRVNCFEIYGFDVMIDSNMKPWVLEVNVLPSLSSSSPFDKRIKTMLVCDTLTCIGLRGYDKTKFHAQTTEVLGLAPFATSMSYGQVRASERLSGNEKLTKDELEMVMDLDEEFLRKGNYERIFPLSGNVWYYEPFFENKRYQNVLIGAYLNSDQQTRDKLLLPRHKRIFFSSV